MTRTLTSQGYSIDHGWFGTLTARLRQAHRARRDAKALAALPRERMQDMGIEPRSAANLRHSGEYGPVPTPHSW